MRLGLLAIIGAIGLAASARANGRFPASTAVVVTSGRTILLGTTFGTVLSTDDGESWRWICEGAIGYGGTFDPVYAVTGAGTLLAGIYDHLSISRDNGCSWSAAEGPLAQQWISDIDVARDGTIWIATATSLGANDVYVSRNDGQSFAPTHVPEERTWWKRVRAAPSDSMRIYASGYRMNPDADATTGAVPLSYRSDDGGAHWSRLPPARPNDPSVALLGVASTNRDLVFAHALGDGAQLLRSNDGGMTWTVVLTLAGPIEGFAIEPDGAHLIAGGAQGNGEVYVSSDGGLTWHRPAQPPKLACAGSHQDGTLYGCGANFTPDFFALGRSTDHGESWSPRFRFADLRGPIECPFGTAVKNQCEPMWPALAKNFGIETAGDRPDAAVVAPPTKPTGCGCGLAAVLLFGVRRRRRA